MEKIRRLCFHLLLCFGLAGFAFCQEEISRNQFPDEFLFGTTSSAYQIEGAVHEDGRSLNNWDTFLHNQWNTKDGSNADVADNHYHYWQDDVGLLHSLGVNAYRFSISWSRILPRGRFGDINSLGIEFYNNLIDDLITKGIAPFVTLCHNDFPQELEDRYSSWLSPLIQEDFAFFAEICFKNFGDRVKYWATMNEPMLHITHAYIYGSFPPGRCSEPFGNCSFGNSDKEPPVAIHNMLLSHTKATDIYRRYYQPSQGGNIGITVDAMMYEPYGDDDNDSEAQKRALIFNVAWILDPLVHGDYPLEVRRFLGSDLPKFSTEESNRIKNSLDFIGVNHYTSRYVKDCIHSPCDRKESRPITGYVHLTTERDGIPIGDKTAMPEIFVVPNGMEKIIGYLKTRYNNKPMFVTENGYPQGVLPIEDLDKLLHDTNRVEYHKSYLASLARAIDEGADVRGYFAWSLMDGFEWTSGYSLGFGLHHVNFRTLKRTPKLSAKWYKEFIANATQVNQQSIKLYSSLNKTNKFVI